jgi:enoyl-CoA hydratase
MELVKVEHHGAVRLITLNDPSRRNLLSSELCALFTAAVRDAQDDPECSAIVFTGAPPAFCAGANLADLEAAADGETGPLHAVYRSFIEVADCTLPTIAAVNGPAVGAGFNLALACDIRLATEDARFDCRFLKLGLHHGGGHGWMLLRAVGWAQAMRMLCLDQAVSAQEAFRMGLVQSLHAPDDLIEAAISMGAAGAALPRDLLLRAKATLRHAATASHAEAFARETQEQMRSLGEAPFRQMVERMKAHMANKKR